MDIDSSACSFDLSRFWQTELILDFNPQVIVNLAPHWFPSQTAGLRVPYSASLLTNICGCLKWMLTYVLTDRPRDSLQPSYPYPTLPLPKNWERLPKCPN